MNEEQRAELGRLLARLEDSAVWVSYYRNVPEMRRKHQAQRGQDENAVLTYVDELLENAAIIDETPGLGVAQEAAKRAAWADLNEGGW